MTSNRRYPSGRLARDRLPGAPTLCRRAVRSRRRRRSPWPSSRTGRRWPGRRGAHGCGPRPVAPRGGHRLSSGIAGRLGQRNPAVTRRPRWADPISVRCSILRDRMEGRERSAATPGNWLRSGAALSVERKSPVRKVVPDRASRIAGRRLWSWYNSREGVAAWDSQTRLVAEHRTDVAARDAGRAYCHFRARGGGRSGVGSPPARATGNAGHRSRGARPRVALDKERVVGHSAATAARAGQRRHVAITLAPRTSAGLSPRLTSSPFRSRRRNAVWSCHAQVSALTAYAVRVRGGPHREDATSVTHRMGLP